MDASDSLYAGGGGLHGWHKLNVGFILARRFTLCAFANFVDVLRLVGRRGRPLAADPLRLEGAVADDGPDRVEQRRRRPARRAARRSGALRLSRRRRRAGRRDREPAPRHRALPRTRAAAAGVPLVGVCTGTFALHRAGLMQGYRACVSWFHHADFLERFDGLEPVSDQIFVVDRDRLTCSGGVSLGASRGLHRRAPPRAGAGGEEPAHHDHRRGDDGGGAAARHAARARHR